MKKLLFTQLVCIIYSTTLLAGPSGGGGGGNGNGGESQCVSSDNEFMYCNLECQKCYPSGGQEQAYCTTDCQVKKIDERCPIKSYNAIRGTDPGPKVYEGYYKGSCGGFLGGNDNSHQPVPDNQYSPLNSDGAPK